MFKLLRYYSIASFFAFFVMAIVVGLVYDRIGTRDVILDKEGENIISAQTLSRHLSSEISQLLFISPGLSTDEFIASPEMESLNEAVRYEIADTKIATIKVYDPSGRVIYSTESNQIGEDESANIGFLSAQSGEPSSKLVYKDTFSVLENEIQNVDVVETYIPIFRNDSSGELEYVFEIYSDVTSMMESMGETKRQVLLGGATVIGALYIVLLIIVRRADRVIRKQHDQSESIKTKLQYDAFHDELTDLPNRSLIVDRIGQAIIRGKRNPEYQFAVLFIDLDRFKNVNDSLGHSMGDEILISIAKRLSESVRAIGTVARFSADEFIVLLDDGKNAYNVSNRILKTLGQPIATGSTQVTVTGSMGVVLKSENYSSPEEVIRDADIAMYRAKALGNNRFEVFNTDMLSTARERLKTETDMRLGIEGKQFRVFYQPIVDLNTEDVIGFEALVRWEHPEKGLLAPNKFLPIARDTGIIIDIGKLVIDEAVQQLDSWKSKYRKAKDLSVSINLSAKQLMDPALIKYVNTILKKSLVDPKYLKFEITEDAFMQDMKASFEVITRLRNMNIEIQLDDFGTGYSSLSVIHELPINAFKIDQSFIKRIGDNRENTSFVRILTLLANELNLITIAEGIERIDQLEFLKKLGCTLGQGYYFSKPLSSLKTEEYIANL